MVFHARTRNEATFSQAMRKFMILVYNPQPFFFIGLSWILVVHKKNIFFVFYGKHKTTNPSFCYFFQKEFRRLSWKQSLCDLPQIIRLRLDQGPKEPATNPLIIMASIVLCSILTEQQLKHKFFEQQFLQRFFSRNRVFSEYKKKSWILTAVQGLLGKFSYRMGVTSNVKKNRK